MSRLSSQTLTLQQFMLRKQVLELYRSFLKVVRQAPKQDQESMKEWVKQDFLANKHLINETDIKMQLSRGRLALREVSSAVHVTK